MTRTLSILIAMLALMLAPESMPIEAQADVSAAQRGWRNARDDNDRREALRALAATDHPEAVRFLVGLLESSSSPRARPNERLTPAIRELVVQSLAGFTSEEALAAVGQAVPAINSDANNKLAIDQYELLYVLARNTESEAVEKHLRATLIESTSPWATMATVRAIRRAEQEVSGAGSRFLKEIMGLMHISRAKLHEQELLTVNVMACLSAMTRKGDEHALDVVRSIVEWQKWSQNSVVRLRDLADRLLYKISEEDCTLTNNTVPFWEWWVANQTARQVAEQPTKQSRTAPVVFKEPIIGTRIVFVIDVSDSMKWPIALEDREMMKEKVPHLDWSRIDTAMDLAIEELAYSLDKLRPPPQVDGPRGTRPKKEEGDERRKFAIITYSKETSIFTEGWQEATNTNLDSWIKEVRNLSTESTTNIHAALLDSFGLSEKAGRAREPEIDRDCVLTGAHTIVFLTDGYPTWSEDSEEQTAENEWGQLVGNGEHVKRDNLLALARRLNLFRNVLINTVGIGKHDEKLMKDMARDAGGAYTDWRCNIDHD